MNVKYMNTVVNFTIHGETNELGVRNVPNIKQYI